VILVPAPHEHLCELDRSFGHSAVTIGGAFRRAFDGGRLMPDAQLLHELAGLLRWWWHKLDASKRQQIPRGATVLQPPGAFLDAAEESSGFHRPVVVMVGTPND